MTEKIEKLDQNVVLLRAQTEYESMFIIWTDECVYIPHLYRIITRIDHSPL